MPSFDLNLLRAAVTLLSFVMFLAIVVWAYSKRNKQELQALGQLPFLGDEQMPEGVRHE
ncbi:cbb3-type cytochrome c oxidase subunit 3 [Roseateles sp. SL47]|jgi:cytochrome c oxidase cbb3-type subunit IV|uniref:cbb3-type cytochrome oxidase subunit 3 n=1 Tax=Roseateles sp. SL47 TaxID=2995138 RepID=UPI00226D77D8|nr:cbb3-type cytochrome c oxidase subunit 3 [Roseateles sp. SL47]WAC70778.1 cbb3-type cytochrome c oxidase subunit 3 [Roseateles sp. SL47]